MPRPPRPDHGRVRRETAPPWRTAHGWVQSRSPLQDMVCRLGCKPIFYSLESRFANFLTNPKLAVDRQIEHRKIALVSLQLKAHANGPDILWLQRALLADQAPLFRGSRC